MVSAAAYSYHIPLKQSDYTKRAQDDRLNLLLRKIFKSGNPSILLPKYQKLREFINSSNSYETGKLIDRLTKDLSDFNLNKDVSQQRSRKTQPNKPNQYINSPQFKRLYPKVSVLFEHSSYGVAARDLLRELFEGKKAEADQLFPSQYFFKRQTVFNGTLIDQFSEYAFDGLKGSVVDLYS